MRGMGSDQQAPGDIRVPVPQKLSAEDMDAYRWQEGVRQPTLKRTLGKMVLLLKKKTGKRGRKQIMSCVHEMKKCGCLQPKHWIFYYDTPPS